MHLKKTPRPLPHWRRRLAAAGLAFLLLFPLSVSASDASVSDTSVSDAASDSSAAASPDGEITTGVTVTHQGGQGTGVLLDRNRSSFLTLAGGDRFEVQAETPVLYLYVIWDRPPAEWTLSAGAATEKRGQHGYLHELVRLDTAATTFSFTLGAGEHVLCDLYFFADDGLPDWVQQWQPPAEKADLVAFSTHADDEHLFFGGILSTYAGERGLAVQVVYMTNHWGERYRPHELLDGLWTVGVTAYPVIGPFPDLFASKESLAAAEQTYTRDAVLAFQVEMLRCFKPAVAVGHDLNGEYGHGAHMLNAATLVEALELTADAANYPESAEQYGTWDVPKTYLHLYAENEIVMNWNIPLERFDGATAFEMAEAGFAKHTSQVAYFSVQQGGTWEDCRKFGLVRSTVGPDIEKNDLFENISFEPPPAPEPDSSAGSVPAGGESGTPAGDDTSDVTAASVPPASTAQPANSGGGPVVLTLVILAAAVVILLLIILLVRLHGGRGKKRRRPRR